MTRERNSVWVTSEQSAHARSTSQQRVTNRSVDACRLEDTERSFCPAPHRSDPPDGFGGTPREPGDGGVSLTPPQPRVLRAEGLWPGVAPLRSEEHTSELQSRFELVCLLLLEKKKT